MNTRLVDFVVIFLFSISCSAFARSDVGRSHKTSGPSEPIIQSLNDAASPFLRRIHPGGLSLDSKNFEEAVYQQPFYNHEPSGPLIASADQIVSGYVHPRRHSATYERRTSNLPKLVNDGVEYYYELPFDGSIGLTLDKSKLQTVLQNSQPLAPPNSFKDGLSLSQLRPVRSVISMGTNVDTESKLKTLVSEIEISEPATKEEVNRIFEKSGTLKKILNRLADRLDIDVSEEDDKETDDHENDEQPDKKENEKEVSVRDREILEFLKALSLIQRGVLKQARQQREDNHSGIASDASVTTSRPSSHLNPELQREDNHSGIASDASVTTSRPSSHLNPELKTAINQTTTAAPSQTSTLKQVRIKRQATDDEETDRRPRLFKRIRSAFGRRQVRATPPPSQATSTTAKSTTKKAEDEAEDQKSMTKSAKDEAEDKKSTTKPAKVEAEDTKSTTKPAKDEAEDKKSTTKPAKVEAEDTTSIAATIKATSPTPTTSATTTTKSSTSTTVNSTEGEHSSHTPGNKPLSGAAVDFYSEAEDPYHQALKNGYWSGKEKEDFYKSHYQRPVNHIPEDTSLSASNSFHPEHYHTEPSQGQHYEEHQGQHHPGQHHQGQHHHGQHHQGQHHHGQHHQGQHHQGQHYEEHSGRQRHLRQHHQGQHHQEQHHQGQHHQEQHHQGQHHQEQHPHHGQRADSDHHSHHSQPKQHSGQHFQAGHDFVSGHHFQQRLRSARSFPSPAEFLTGNDQKSFFRPVSAAIGVTSEIAKTIESSRIPKPRLANADPFLRRVSQNSLGNEAAHLTKDIKRHQERSIGDKPLTESFKALEAGRIPYPLHNEIQQWQYIPSEYKTALRSSIEPHENFAYLRPAALVRNSAFSIEQPSEK